MADTNNRRAPRVPPGSTSLAAAAQVRDAADYDHLNAAFEDIGAMILTLDAAQLFDHLDNAADIRLASTMLRATVKRVRAVQAELSQRLDDYAASVLPA